MLQKNTTRSALKDVAHLKGLKGTHIKVIKQKNYKTKSVYPAQNTIQLCVLTHDLGFDRLSTISRFSFHIDYIALAVCPRNHQNRPVRKDINSNSNI